jgi:hypothetical protein
MLTIPADQWQQLLPRLKAKCPRLTSEDLLESLRRIDLLIAKIQNRHWIDRITARRIVLSLLQETGGVPTGT